MPGKKRTTEDAATETQPSAPGAIKTRIVAPMQSAGRLGKSTFTDVLLSWLDHAGIESYAVDCDAEHGTLSQRYDVNTVNLAEPGAMENLLTVILENPDPAPVVALDFPAQATDHITNEWKRLYALDAMDAAGYRLTVPLFLVDDAAAVESLAKVVNAFGSRVDYVLVKNPARGPYERPERTPMATRLRDAGAPTILLPEITKATRDAIAVVETRADKRLPLAEAVTGLNFISRVQLEGFLGSVWKQMEDAADYLLPNRDLIQNPVSAARNVRLESQEPAKKLNRLDPMG